MARPLAPIRARARLARPLLTFAALLGLTACTQHHYLVRVPDLPLYATPSGDELLASLPRFHHEPLQVDPDEVSGARIPLSYRGQQGYAPRRGLLLFSYLDPNLDEGRDRVRELRVALREAQLEAFGQAWPEEVKLAIREGHVREGMTPRQVEVAWGWPTEIEETPAKTLRWTYERQRTEVVQEPVAFSGWSYPVLGGPGWRLDYAWTLRHERISERRVVVFGPDQRVVAILSRSTRL